MMIEFITDYLPLFMIISLAVLLFTGFPVAFLLAGTGVLFTGIGILLDEFPIVALFNIPLRVWGSVNGSLIYPTVPMLLFMGIALEKSGVAREMLLSLQRLLRGTPGSLAVAITILGIVLAPSAGLIGASVATLALIGLPTMLAQNYRSSFAAGSVAAAGTLGIILPPGIMLFFLADLMRVSIGPMFVSTLIPGFALAGLFIVYYVTRAALDPAAAPPPKYQEDIPFLQVAWETTRNLALPVALIAAVLGSIIAGLATPVHSAAVGAAGSMIILWQRGRFTVRWLNEVVVQTILTTSMVFFILIAASIFSYPFNFYGGSDMISDFMRGLGYGDWGTLMAIMLLVFILGFFIDWIEITVIVLPILLPLIRAMDFSEHTGSKELGMIWITVQFALVLQSSFLTPPFGFSLFFLKGAAPPGITLADTYRGVAPLVVIQVLMVAAVIIWPQMAVWLPSLLME